MAIRFGNNRQQYMSEKKEKINRLTQSLINAEQHISTLKAQIETQNSDAVEREREFMTLINQLQAQNLNLQTILIEEREADEVEDAEYQALIARLQNENVELALQTEELSETIVIVEGSFDTERNSLKKEIQNLLQSLINKKEEIQELNSSIVNLRQQEQHIHSHLTSAIETFKQILIVHKEIMHLCEKYPSLKKQYHFYNITTSISDHWLMQGHETTKEWDQRLAKVLTTIKEYKVSLADAVKVRGKTPSDTLQRADENDFSSTIEEYLLANKNKRFIIKSIAKSAHITIGLAAQHVETIRSALILEARSDIRAFVKHERANNQSDSVISEALLDKYPINQDEIAMVLQQK